MSKKKKSKRNTKGKRRAPIRHFEGGNKSLREKELEKHRGHIRLLGLDASSQEFHEILVFRVPRDEVEAGLPGAFAVMEALKNFGAPSYSLVLSFDGYENDSRGVWNIPECCSFFLHLVLLDPEWFCRSFVRILPHPKDPFFTQFQMIAFAFGMCDDNGTIIIEYVRWVRFLLLGQDIPKESVGDWSKIEDNFRQTSRLVSGRIQDSLLRLKERNVPGLEFCLIKTRMGIRVPKLW
jgi:hypothetical protein